MNEDKAKQILTDMKDGKSPSSVEEKIEIFNWYIKEKGLAMSVSWEGGRETWLKDIQIETAENELLLNYSMLKISEDLDIIPRSTSTVRNYFGKWVLTHR